MIASISREATSKRVATLQALALVLISAATGALTAEEAPQLKITAPKPNSVVMAGSTITVEVVGNPGVTVDTVLVVGVDQAANSTQAPFHVSFEVPLEAFGPYEITAFGKNSATNDYYTSASIPLDVKTDAALLSLKIPATTFVGSIGSCTLFVGDTEHLSVTGIFSDGVDRKIPMSKVKWRSGDLNVVTVDALGIATGVAAGKTLVTASAYELENSLEVDVFLQPH